MANKAKKYLCRKIIFQREGQESSISLGQAYKPNNTESCYLSKPNAQILGHTWAVKLPDPVVLALKEQKSQWTWHCMLLSHIWLDLTVGK